MIQKAILSILIPILEVKLIYFQVLLCSLLKKCSHIGVSILFVPLIILALAINNPQQGITDIDTSTDAEKTSVEVIPIAVSDILIISTETITQLDEIRLELKPIKNVNEVEKNFQEFKANITIMERKLDSVNLNDLKFNRLMVLQNSWEDEKSKLLNWQNILQSRSEELENFRQLLANRQQEWGTTRKAALEREDPEALIIRIKEVLDLIDDVDQALKIRQETILTLMDQITQESIRINKALTQISEAHTQTREHIFTLDSPPIWKVFEKDETRPSFRKQITQATDSRLSLLDEFIRPNWLRMIFHFMIFIIILLFLFKIKNRGDLWIEKNALESRFKYIYQYPFYSALLLALVFTPYFYTNMHEFIRESNRLLIMLPLIRVLPKIIYCDMITPLLGLLILYVLQSMDEIIIEFLIVQRLILLFISIVGMIFFIWNLRPNGPLVRRNEGNWWRAFVMSTKIASVIFALSILANIFGNIKLADLLTNAVLNIAYTGVILLAAIRILENIIFVAFKIKFLSRFNVVKSNTQLIQHRIFNFLRLLAIIIWIVFSLKNFNIYKPFETFIQEFLSKSWQIGSMEFVLADILIFAITIWLSVLISRFIRFVLEEDILPQMHLHRGIPASISIITHYAILATGFLIALSAAGIEWSRFSLLAGAFVVGIGFGLQNVVNNFISGLILIFERPIKVEDTIEVGELRGIVKRIGIRSSTIRTFDGAEVIVPNGTLIQSEVTNWTLSDQLRRIKVKVGVSYESDPKQVIKILANVAKRHPLVLDYPEPKILFQEFGDSSLNFSLRVWTSDFDNWLSISSDITLQLHDALKKAGIEIPFPQRDLNIRTINNQNMDILETAKKRHIKT